LRSGAVRAAVGGCYYICPLTRLKKRFCLAQKRKSDKAPPLIIPRPEHNVSRSNVSKNALKVLYRLKDAGYQAFLVGGGVRDLLLGRRPKDFDIATDASPENMRALFSNCRLIGRRFRLAHVRFGREVIEVATFRGNGADAGPEQKVCEESGRILSDNAYGTIDEDAWRRDFTVNALYYNIAGYSVWDFVGGMEDIRARRLRMIGDAEVRFREDPVRMLRAARLAAKLDFSIHPDTAGPIPEMASLIDGVPAARLLDEFLKMFQTGHALASYRRLRELKLFEHLFPATAECLEADADGRVNALIERALASTDERVAAGKAVTPMFLFGVFMWHPVCERVRVLMESGSPSEYEAMLQAIADVTARQSRRITLPRRFSFPMREILQLQARFEKRRGSRAMKLLGHRRFRAAFDLLLLRAEIGEADPDTARFWTEVQEMSPAEQKKAFGLGRRRARRSANRAQRAHRSAQAG